MRVRLEYELVVARHSRLANTDEMHTSCHFLTGVVKGSLAILCVHRKMMCYLREVSVMQTSSHCARQSSLMAEFPVAGHSCLAGAVSTDMACAAGNLSRSCTEPSALWDSVQVATLNNERNCCPAD